MYFFWLLSVKDLEPLDGTDSDTVNMAEFWEDVEKCEIARGILPPGRALFMYNTLCFSCNGSIAAISKCANSKENTRVTLYCTGLLMFKVHHVSIWYMIEQGQGILSCRSPAITSGHHGSPSQLLGDMMSITLSSAKIPSAQRKTRTLDTKTKNSVWTT